LKNDDNFFDGLDERYHHAKFGEDRTTRAGCRYENVVFVTMFVCYRQDAAKQQTAGIKFTHRPKIEVFRLDALALSVIATPTWLAGWLAGCHTPVLYQNG